MKGNPMKRNFGIGESPMRIGGLIKAFAKRFATKATKAKKDIPNIKAVDIKTGKTVSSKDFDPMKTYRYEEIAKPKATKAKSKVTGRTKYSYHDYNKDVKGRIRQ